MLSTCSQAICGSKHGQWLGLALYLTSCYDALHCAVVIMCNSLLLHSH